MHCQKSLHALGVLKSSFTIFSVKVRKMLQVKFTSHMGVGSGSGGAWPP